MRYLIIILSSIILFSCSPSEQKENNSNVATDYSIQWSINTDYLIGELDPFPLIDSLHFENINDFNSINNDHRVAIIPFENSKLAFLFHDLAFFEVLNFNYNNNQYAITHCPITNTTQAFLLPNGETLRASGYRYKDNLIMSNSTSSSFISQMLEKSIGGNSMPIVPIPVIDTKWSTLVDFYPDAKLSFINDTEESGCSDEQTCNSSQNVDWENMSIGFNNDLIRTEINIFNFSNNIDDKIIFNHGNTLIVGLKSKNLVRIFNSNTTINAISDNISYFSDTENNKYDWNGNCFEGPDSGTKLTPSNSYLGSTFSFNQVFEETHLIN